MIAYENVSTGTVVIRKPPGQYVVEAEAPGYKRASFGLQLGGAPTEYVVRLEPSTVPLSLQRLLPPGEAVLENAGNGV